MVTSCEVLPGSACPSFREIASALPIAYSSSSNTSLFVPRKVIDVFHSVCLRATLAPVLHVSKRHLSVKKDNPSELSVCRLASSAAFFLLPAKWLTILENSTGPTHSMCCVPKVTLMSLPAVSALSSLCPRSTHLSSLGLVYTLISSGCSPNWACSSPSNRVTGRKFLTSRVLSATRSLRPYLRCKLFSSRTAGWRPASHTTTLIGADGRIPVIAIPCQLISF